MNEQGPTRRPRRDRRRAVRGSLVLAVVAVVLLGTGAGDRIARGVASATPPPSTATSVAGSTRPERETLPPCRLGDRLTPHRRPEDWARTLLDHELRLAATDVPRDLVRLVDAGIDGNGQVRGFVVEDLRRMSDDARAAGAAFRVTSAYRSFDQQRRTFASLETAYGREEALRSAARPGHSEHQLGTTIDVSGGEAWLAANAHRYGFVLSYPEEHSPATTCYKPEPWHFRYLGHEALAVRDSGISLRAWLWERQRSR